MSCKICGRNSCTESFHSLEEQEKHENPEAYYEDIISKLETDKEALESENEKLKKRVKELEAELKDRTKIREITEKLRQQWDDYQALQAKVEDYENRVIPSWKREEKLWEAENEKLRLTIDQLKICLELGDDQKFYEILTQAPTGGGE
ncbi:hypothetical protein LCGC14_2917330 [marine sediment metagenome]|uniref:Uncharacterized protein n=1 Tax=marine sediment metagenome TaxID=412755 RepID=A0A0F8XQ21_9ZZZZ